MSAQKCDVLVVDDEQDLVEIYLEYFRDAGLQAEGSRLPWEAVHMLSVVSPRVLIIDNQMPGLRGLDLLEAARKSGVSLPPTVVVTGFGDLDFARACEMGVGAVLQKPFRVENLIGVIRSTIGGRNHSQKRHYVRIPSSLKATINGVEVRLTDIGLGGCSIDVRGNAVSDQAEQSLEILTKSMTPIQLIATPVWRHAHQVGIQFQNPSLETQVKVLNLVSNLAQEQRLET